VLTNDNKVVTYAARPQAQAETSVAWIRIGADGFLKSLLGECVGKTTFAREFSFLTTRTARTS